MGLLRAPRLFYSILFPVWEGFDEYSHFAYIQHIAVHGELPRNAQIRVSKEVEESLKLFPLPWMLRGLYGPHATHDEYWTLAREERARRQKAILELPRGWALQAATENLPNYESKQAPLYYFMLSFPLTVLSNTSMPSRVIILRLLSVGLASLIVPLGFLIAVHVFADRPTAVGVTALAAAMPELMVNVCRVSNECLAVVLYSSLVYLSLRMIDGTPSVTQVSLLGVCLGLGLLTKAYFLTALPAVVVIFAWKSWVSRVQRRRILLQGFLAVSISILVSGWWYWRNRTLTGSWSGEEPEAVLPLRDVPRIVTQVDWRNAIDTIFHSHISFGNWSFLTVRYWIYHVFGYLALFALFGLFILLARLWSQRIRQGIQLVNSSYLLVLLAFYLSFWLGLGYHVLKSFVVRSVSSSQGWYLYCLVVVEILLVTVGLFELVSVRRRSWVLPALTSIFVLLDLYTAHFLLIPYYSGLIAHRQNGALATFHFGQVLDFDTALLRLGVNKPGILSQPALVSIWAAFLVATVALTVFSLGFASRFLSANQKIVKPHVPLRGTLPGPHS